MPAVLEAGGREGQALEFLLAKIGPDGPQRAPTLSSMWQTLAVTLQRANVQIINETTD